MSKRRRKMRRDPRQKAYRAEKHRNAGSQCDSLSLVMTKRNNYNKEIKKEMKV